jgi:FAD/FMN-containing dehydrogenase/Fe-S oxidoreductase
MNTRVKHADWERLSSKLEGDLYQSGPWKIMYATDASAYRSIPEAVVRPKNANDIRLLIQFAGETGIPLVPRAAGTSLAGQVVGEGIVVDISKYFNRIIELNVDEHWVRVEPGVVLDELNLYLQPKGLFFAPETSTANRCMIGGMIGNNACGAHSLLYGSTRDHTVSVKGFLSDGSFVEFSSLTPEEFNSKCKGTALENSIYRQINEVLGNSEKRKHIQDGYPDPRLERRNTGYAIDILSRQSPFSPEGKDFNFSSLIAGSEGTLMFVTEIKLNLEPLPPKVKGLICAHFNTLEEAYFANLIILKHNPGAIELIDKVILDCTKENITQRKNRFFIQNDPGAVLVIEFARESVEEIEDLRSKVVADLTEAGLGYYFPLILGPDINKVWALRKAGLGLLSNLPGDSKPVSVIEDTAVHPEFLPRYIADFNVMLKSYGLNCVYHAHIATGELHLRPVLNLKDPHDLILFREVATKTALLVKKYRGSLSGEHGDGRLRGEFIPLVLGEENMEILRNIKETWDPLNIFNPGKIVHTPPMDSSLRYEPGSSVRQIKTIFDFSSSGSFLQMTEKCNGSGDCRKSELIGGTMCPSFMATRNENTTTRARANILREYITHSTKEDPFDSKEIYDVLDLCLSCKGCKSECPSNVDMAKLKAEFLQHWYDLHGIPLRSRLIAYITSINALGSLMPSVFNFFVTNKLFAGLFKKITGFAQTRSIPLLANTTLKKWARKNLNNLNSSLPLTNPEVNLFVDEFTNYNDTSIGISAIKLLNKLGYRIALPAHGESARTYVSKGLIRKAKKIANKNLKALHDKVSLEKPLLGIEPSAILSFRDEYPDLAEPNLKETAAKLAGCAFMIDEFLCSELDKGKINKELFTSEPLLIKLHGHCQQKAIASTEPTKKMLSIPVNYKVEEIPSGCCGMAGSFGYEKEHYEISMKVGELVLFPAIRKTSVETIIAAPGTSCRHQIKDGTGRKALHPVEILLQAVK